MSTRHQQKAERTFFPRQRRCISESVPKPQHPTVIQHSEVIEEKMITSPEKPSPKRQRCITEIPKSGIKREILDDEEDEELIDVLNIEDDVVIDDSDEKPTKDIKVEIEEEK